MCFSHSLPGCLRQSQKSHPHRSRLVLIAEFWDDEVMEVSKEAEKFGQIWQEEVNEEISEDAARERIGELDALYLLLARRSWREDEPRNLKR
jgi:hypothetical protein